jgi:hypothetical protein
MSFELKQFLVSGEIGVIRCGISRENVVSTFGEAPAKQNLHDADGSIGEVRYGYGALSLFFQKGLLAGYGLCMDSDPDCEIPEFLHPVGYFPVGGKVPLVEFVDYLRKEGISFRERREEEDEWFKFFTEGDVGIGAGGPRNNVFCLLKVCLGTELWRTYKQRVSLAIPGITPPFLKTR